MARTLFRLNERTVRSLNAPGYHADGGGLYLQVSRSGSKSWIYRYTLRKRTRDKGLGSAIFVSLAEARAKAAEYRKLAAEGRDPVDEARSARALNEAANRPKPVEPTFREFAEEYIRTRADSWRNDKHRLQWHASLARFAFPILGGMRLADIDTPHVLRVLEPIWMTKSETASRVRGRIERILAAASVRGLRPPANPAAWVGHLREALPPKRKGKSFASLPYHELPVFLEALRAIESVTSRALEFLILAAARSGEVRGARWSEIDHDANVWTVPGDRMKAGRAHAVPLSDRASVLLDEVFVLRDLRGGFLFPGTKAGQMLSDMTLTGLVKSMGYKVTVHGFRATFKTWAEQETNHPNVVIEAALAHIVGDKAERAYMRGDWFAKRRLLMADWAAFCTARPEDKVIPLRAAQR